MSVLSKIESEVTDLEKTSFGSKLFRGLRFAGLAAVGYVVAHVSAVSGTGGVSAIVGGAVLAGETAFRTVFPTVPQAQRPPSA